VTPDTPERPEHAEALVIDALLYDFQQACEEATGFVEFESQPAKDAAKLRAILRNDLRARLLASSLGEPVSQEAPSVEAIDADDVSDLLQFIHDNAYDAKESRRFRNLVADLERIAKRASRSAFSGIPRTENEPCTCALAGLDATTHDGHLADCPKYASVISSASPLSEDEQSLITRLREFGGDGWKTPQHEVRRLLSIIDRLSASALFGS
jgi:hypothetical protein